MKDIFGTALLKFYLDDSADPLYVVSRDGSREQMFVGMYYRTYSDMPEVETRALEICIGKVLEVGAGAGSHAILLEGIGRDVEVVEISPGACEVMKTRGIEKVHCTAIFDFKRGGFDTILLLMNGIGLVETLQGFRNFLAHCKTLLNRNGTIVFDSSDVKYLFKKGKLPEDHYYGEIEFQYEYEKQLSDWFKWLYLDELTLQQIAKEEGWNCSIVYKDDSGQYLAQLSVNEAGSA